MLRRGVLVGSAVLLMLGLAAPRQAATAQTAPVPNIVFILTDDQPVGTLAGMANATALAGRREVQQRDHLQPVVLPVARDDPDWLPARAQTLRDDAYAAGCDPTIVPPPTG